MPCPGLPVAPTTEGAPVDPPPSVDSQEAPTQDSFTAATPTLVAPQVDIQPAPKVVRPEAVAPPPSASGDGRRWIAFSIAAAAFLVVMLGGALGLRMLLDRSPSPDVPADPAPEVAAEPDAFPLLTPAPAGHQVDQKALKKALRKAENAIDDDDHVAAKEAYAFAIQIDPGSPEAHRGYGLAAYQLGELELAKAHLEHLFDLDDDTIAAQAAGFLAIIEKKLELKKKREQREQTQTTP